MGTMGIRMLIARLKDKFAIKVPTFSYSPAPCPKCGFVIEVPLTRTTVSISCSRCSNTCYTMAVGILDQDPSRLKHVYSEVISAIQKSSLTYKPEAKHTIN